MGNKYKPSKSVAKRFRVTKTGKVKHNHSFTSHLMRARPAKRRRKLRRASVLHEGHARNMRLFMGVSGLKPKKIAHDRALAAQERAKEAAAPAAS